MDNYRSHPFLASLESGAPDGGTEGGGRAATGDQNQSPARPPALAVRLHRAPSPGLPPRRCADGGLQEK